jgi:hypothetical protein
MLQKPPVMPNGRGREFSAPPHPLTRVTKNVSEFAAMLAAVAWGFERAVDLKVQATPIMESSAPRSSPRPAVTAP